MTHASVSVGAFPAASTTVLFSGQGWFIKSQIQTQE
jgi:hypothetical protein